MAPALRSARRQLCKTPKELEAVLLLNKCSLGNACAESLGPSVLPYSPPRRQASFSVFERGGTLKKTGLGTGRGSVWGWQLTLGSSKLSSHGQNSEHTVLYEQLKLTFWIRQHMQLNYTSALDQRQTALEKTKLGFPKI